MKRRNSLAALLASVLLAACSSAPVQEDEHAAHADPASAAQPAAAVQDPALPASAEQAPERLARSPRHGEWTFVRTGAADSVRAWIVYPERSTRAPVVLVVHEIYGVTHWIRGVADQLAAEGFIAIAPDLADVYQIPTQPDGDPVRDQATARIRALDAAAYNVRLQAVADWGMSLPAATQRYGIVGFCWGGTASFTHATAAPRLGASVVYYGSSPPTASLAAVRAPVLGLYAGDDARVNTTIDPAAAELRRLNRAFESHLFDGAGHGFLRQQEGRDGANLAATRRAWPMTLSFFRQHLEN